MQLKLVFINKTVYYGELHFPCLLHRCGTDRVVRKNTWDAGRFGFGFHDTDTELLRVAIRSLLGDDTGVSELRIHPYVISIGKCAAVDWNQVLSHVQADIGLNQPNPWESAAVDINPPLGILPLIKDRYFFGRTKRK